MKAKTRYKTQFHPQRALSEINIKTYEYIDSLDIESVFEFGCGVGRHLDKFKERGMYVMGSDINKEAVREANKKGLTVFLGDESVLSNIPSDSFDVVFTNSVLCHIPSVDGIISELKRISKKHLIFVERQQEDEGHWYVHEYEGEKVFTMTTKTTGYDYSLFHLCV